MASLISVGQVLDRSLEHGRKHYKELIAITLWIVIASIPSITGKLLAPSGGDQGLTNGDWLTFGLSLFGALLVAVISVWTYAALVLAVAEQAAGKRPNLKQVYKQAWQLFWRYVLLTIILALVAIGIGLLTAPGLILIFLSNTAAAAGAAATLGVPLLFIGAIIALILITKYGIEMAFAPYILLLESRGVIPSIKTSIQLVRGRWWATLVRFALPKLLYFLALFAISFVVFKALALLLAVLVTSSSLATLVVYTLSLFLSVFLSAIVTPLIIVTDYYLYDSLRKTR